MQNTLKEDKLIFIKQVSELTGYSISSIYRLKAKKQFPQSIQLGENRIAWLESDINSWLQDRINKSRPE